MSNLSLSVSAFMSRILNDEDMSRERFQDPAIQQNKNGSYYIRPWVDRRTGEGLERTKKTFILGDSTVSKKELALSKRQIMDMVNNRDQVIKSQILFSELVSLYRNRHMVPKFAASTLCKVEALLKIHILPEFGGKYLYQINGVQIESWMTSKKLSWASKKDLKALLSNIFSNAIRWKLYTDSNPLQYVFIGKQKAVREKVKLTDKQMMEFLALLPEDVRLMVHIALFCGLRVSEILGLREKDLNFERKVIQIENRYFRGDVDKVKSESSNRCVPMGLLEDDLNNLCKGAPERFIINIQTHRDRKTPTICRSDTSINHYFLRPTAKLVGCYTKGFGFHTFRREAITEWNASLGVTQAMKLAGHTKPSMSALYTLADYQRQDGAIRARQVELMGEGKDLIQ